jgi:probable phosphoglycerate mutase
MLGLCLFGSLVAAAGLGDLGPVPAGTVRVYLVRHGQAFTNLDDPPALPPDQLDRLTDLGRTHAQSAGRALLGRDIVLVISSPAGRARETAELIATRLGAGAVRIEPRLRPLDLGRGPEKGPLDWDARIAEWKAGRDPAPPGGESLEQVGKRVLEVVESLRRDHAGRSVALVAHSEVIASFAGLLRGTPAARRYPPGIDLGSITVVETAGAGFPTLRLTNSVPLPERVP